MALEKLQRPASPGFHKSNSLSVRLVVETLIFSLLISVLASAVQIYSSYKTSIASAKHLFSEIETGYLPSLSAGLWEVNGQRVDALLDSIAQIPNVGHILLIDEVGSKLTRNKVSDSSFSKREMPLRYMENGTSFDVGRLMVELNNDVILARLKDQAIVTAMVTSLTLFFSALLILFLFQWRVSRHLQTMAVFASAFNVHRLDIPLTLERKPTLQPDELDIVVRAINEMQRELRRELDLRSDVEFELRTHKENLEMVIKERTLELKSSVDQLAVAADVAELGVWQWNIDDGSLQWNARMYSIFSQPTSLADNGLNYQHWFERVHPEDADVIAASLQAEVEGRGKMHSDFRIMLPDGTVRYVQAGLKIERDNQGRAIKAIGINLDITPRMEIENSLRAAKQQADAASASKSSFLANMSHEIRTPMNAVLGMLQLLQKTELSNRQADYLVKCQNAAKSLLNLLNDILDLSKADAGKLVLDSSPFDLESLLQDLAVVLSGNQKDRNVELMFDVDPSLPRLLMGDKFRLQQILINLAGNALKFTLDGQVRVLIEQMWRSTTEVSLKFSVIDTGIGISDDHIDHIFDEFVQAEASTTRRFGGTGLGLVISKHLVQRMGGELRVQSKLEEGSHFWFEVTFPLGDQALSTELDCWLSLSGIRILVVDDNAVGREIVVRNLQQTNSIVSEIDSGLKALEHIRQADQNNQPFDIVLLDWQMPDLDGLSTSELIKSDVLIVNKPIVVLLSAYGYDEILAHEQDDAPCYVDILYKPITPLQLLQRLGRAIGKGSVIEHHIRSVSARPLTGLKLLVVEDNVINRQIASELLKDEGAEVELAECGLDGVKTVLEATYQFDAVLMDIQMPGIDGLEATRRIRADPRFSTLPILAMTANVAEQDVENCLAAGMNGHIGKPIDIDQVVLSILAVIAKNKV